jgi:hypothetical protein
MRVARWGELSEQTVAKAVYLEQEARDLVHLLLETLDYMHPTT